MSQKKKNNFLDLKSADKQKSKKNRKKLKTTLISVGIIVAIIILLVIFYWQPAKSVYAQALAGRDNFLVAQEQLLNQEFGAAQQSLTEALDNFNTAQQEFKKFRWLKIIPWLGTQISATDNLLSAGIKTGQGIASISQLANEIITPFQDNDNLSLASLSEEETKNLLKAVYEAKKPLEEAKLTIDEAVDHINKIPATGLLKQLNNSIGPLREKIPQIQEGVARAISACQIIPSITGYPQEKTYLFLLQNNTEMRPTGGFIGTFGILKVKDGDIKYFATDNVYNLDEPAEAYLNVEPPWPLTHYNKVYKWFLRDSNWSPDFPTAAQKAEWFYHQEKGSEKNIDGIIAVTPSFIESLLTVTGEIPVNGITFTHENLIETLQYQVEKGFLRQGLAEGERKEIIGVLSQKILDEIFALPQEKWPDLWSVFAEDISEKQILIFVKDEYIQNLILKENWGGEVQSISGDYLMVIDANLASLKTDPDVTRTIEYTLRQDGKNLISDVNITYDHQGDLTWKTTRYRTYTRIYVPKGSKLLKVEGAMVDCKLSEEGSVETTEELDKTVFGTFICIEPGEKKTLSFKYKLPDDIYLKLKNNTYDLLVQKQAGAQNHDSIIYLDFNQKPKQITPVDNVQETDNNKLKFTTELNKDLKINLKY